MKKIFPLLLALLPMLSGCYGTLCGFVAGPVMGGPSLTGKLYDSEALVPTKIIGTPFAMATGAALGIFPGLWNGIEYDLWWLNITEKGPETNDLFDPWHRSLVDGRRLFKIEKETDPHSLYHPSHYDRTTGTEGGRPPQAEE